jgi:HK97 family phage portal protein
MNLLERLGLRAAQPTAETRSASIENPTVPVSAENFLTFFTGQGANLPHVTVDSALKVPAVWAAVAFLSRTLAAIPLHAYRTSKSGAVKATGKIYTVAHDAPNESMSSFAFRQYFWQQVFTGGRGLAWIERTPQGVEALWPMDPLKTTIKRVGHKIVYQFGANEYAAGDVIDVPFMLRPDGIRHYGPINMAGKAIQLALAMNEYGSNFFAGGGVPPLALSGPLPTGNGALKRAMDDVSRAIDAAKSSDKPVFPIPAGYTLVPVGFDPAKGQMLEARLFQVQEIARTFQLPPNFLQDLSKATFANVEQNDLYLVKHLIGQWAKALEGEMNLKLFGRGNTNKYVEHNLDGLMRGDFKSRTEGIARAIQTAQLTPNEARAMDNRPAMANGGELLVQGATVPLGTQPLLPTPAPEDDDKSDGAEAA